MCQDAKFSAVTSHVRVQPTTATRAWLWPGRFPIGQVSAVVGNGGLVGSGRCVGKGWLTCDMAAHVSTGTDWPDGSPCERGSVLMANADDDVGTVRFRLGGCGADVSRVAQVLWRGTGHPLPAGHRSAVDLLIGAVEAMPGCRLLVIDPVAAFMGRAPDRLNVHALATIAEQYRLAVVVVGDAQDVRASASLGRVATAVWQIKERQTDRRRRLLVSLTDGMQGGDDLSFRIEGNPTGVRWLPACPKGGGATRTGTYLHAANAVD